MGLMRPLRFPKTWLALGWAYVALVVALSLVDQPPGPQGIPHLDKAEHLMAYGIMAAWFSQLFRGGALRWHAAGFIALGGLMEILQGMLGGLRQPEWADAAANATGVILATLVFSGKKGEILAALEKRLRGQN